VSLPTPAALSALSALCLSAAVLVAWADQAGGAATRLRHVTAAVLPREPLDDTPGRARVKRWAASAAAALACLLLVGGVLGAVLAAVALVALPRWLARQEPASTRLRREARAAELPLLLDVLAACLSVGATPASALATVARAAGPDLGADLDRACRALAAGASLDDVWRGLPGDIEVVGRVLARSARSGAAAAPLLRSSAAELRADRRAARLDAARRLGVHAAAPLGLCFLPGFVLLGLVPVIVGLVAGIR